MPTAAPVIFALCKSLGIPAPVAEYRVTRLRRWRFDYAWPAQMIALEVEGGAWTNGRHTRGSGFVKDMEKYNFATLNGWRLLRCTPDQLAKGFGMVAELIKQEAND